MKIIRNKYIPFPGYKAINLFGVLFVKNNAKIDEVTINHESIHSAQIAEVMIASVPFALLLWLFTDEQKADLYARLTEQLLPASGQRGHGCCRQGVAGR